MRGDGEIERGRWREGEGSEGDGEMERGERE